MDLSSVQLFLLALPVLASKAVVPNRGGIPPQGEISTLWLCYLFIVSVVLLFQVDMGSFN